MEGSQQEQASIQEEKDWDHQFHAEDDPPVAAPEHPKRKKRAAVGGLNEDVTKRLLDSFEHSGNTRDTFDLWSLCDSNPSVFGAEGSTLRRQVQQRWAKCKNRSIKAHISYLNKLGVIPGKVSLAEFAEFAAASKNMKQNKAPPSDNSSTASNSHTTSEEIIVEEHEDPYAMLFDSNGINPPPPQDDVASLSDNFQQVVLLDEDEDTKPAARAHPPPAIRHQNNNHEASAMFHTPPRPPMARSFVPGQQQHRFGQLSPLVSAAANSSPSHPFIPISWFVKQNGTVQHPWIVPISKYAERHRDFDVQFVQGINQEGFFTCNGFHVRRHVACPDMNDWEATIPDRDYEEMWHGRLIRFKGPAQDFFVRDTERYHEGIGRDSKVNCDATFKAHSATEVAIDDSKEKWCQVAYWLFVCAPGVVLDNKIFSKDDNVVPMIKNPLKLKKDHPVNLFGKDILAMTLYWRIAISGGQKIGGKQSQKTQEAEARNMFSE